MSVFVFYILGGKSVRVNVVSHFFGSLCYLPANNDAEDIILLNFFKSVVSLFSKYSASYIV
jgi:hypothetical protein